MIGTEWEGRDGCGHLLAPGLLVLAGPCCLRRLSRPLGSGVPPPRGSRCQTASKRKDELNEGGRMKRRNKQKKNQKKSRKEGTECQDKDVLSVILAPAVCPVKAWKGCCLSTILSADIQNPISGCGGAGFLSDSGPFVRRAINEEHWQR